MAVPSSYLNPAHYIPILLILFSCSSEEPQQDQGAELGQIQVYATGSEASLQSFREGMLLLHSFEYVDAAEKFAQAQALDSTCAMAYWGEAMTHNHPLWREQATEKAVAILSRLDTTPESRAKKVTTDLEKDLFKACELLYTGATDKKERDQLYANFMGELHQKYPDNHEVGSLYALSLLGAVKEGRDYEEYAKGAVIAESIIAENPSHPGALHYLIHSYDDPENAPKALLAANSYAKVAPAASHALHMPSHIYVAMGMWDDVVSSNIASWEASVNRKEAKHLDNDELGYHALLWLSYGHLQRGEYDLAHDCVSTMEKYCHEEPSNRAKFHLMMMKAAYLTETNEWEDPMLQDTFTYDHALGLRTTDRYIDGLQALRSQDLAAAQDLIDEMKSDRLDSSKEAEASSAVMCAGRYNRRMATPTEVKRAHVVELELRALLADAEGNANKAEEFFKQAIALEEQTTFQFGPPSIVQPSSELYANWLMEQERWSEAAARYESVLERAPGRKIATEGMTQAVSAGS